MRVSLKDLFAIIAFSAVVAACAVQVGFDNVVFWIAIIASTVMSGLMVHFLAMDDNRRQYALLVPVPLLFCCLLPIGSLALFINAALLFLVGVYCALRPATLRSRTLWTIALICASVSFGLGVLPGVFATRDLSALRKEFPMVSIDDRLRYELEANSDTKPQNAFINVAVSQQLAAFDQNLQMDGFREHQFRQIHEHQYELFVRSIGFGVSRMMRPRSEYLRRSPLRDIGFDEVPINEAYPVFGDWRSVLTAGLSSQVEHLHVASQNDFLDADSFGAIIDPKSKVVGFVEHGFHYSPLIAMKNREVWTIVRIELVSLLKFDEPRVYILDHLPRMDQLSQADVPTRQLDAFEADSLQKLWTQEDVVVSCKGHEYRMLGSLRAAKQCLECHNVQRGELLGAFSYVLHDQEGVSFVKE